MDLVVSGAGAPAVWLTSLVPYGDVAERAVACYQNSWDISPAITITVITLAVGGLSTMMRILFAAIWCVLPVFGFEINVAKIPVQVECVLCTKTCDPHEIWIVPTADGKRWHSIKNCSILARANVTAAVSYLPCKSCSLRFWLK